MKVCLNPVVAIHKAAEWLAYTSLGQQACVHQYMGAPPPGTMCTQLVWLVGCRCVMVAIVGVASTQLGVFLVSFVHSVFWKWKDLVL